MRRISYVIRKYFGQFFMVSSRLESANGRQEVKIMDLTLRLIRNVHNLLPFISVTPDALFQSEFIGGKSSSDVSLCPSISDKS